MIQWMLSRKGLYVQVMAIFLRSLSSLILLYILFAKKHQKIWCAQARAVWWRIAVSASWRGEFVVRWQPKSGPIHRVSCTSSWWIAIRNTFNPWGRRTLTSYCDFYLRIVEKYCNRARRMISPRECLMTSLEVVCKAKSNANCAMWCRPSVKRYWTSALRLADRVALKGL